MITLEDLTQERKVDGLYLTTADGRLQWFIPKIWLKQPDVMKRKLAIALNWFNEKEEHDQTIK